MRTRNSTVLVTGGLGYIGSYVVRDLRERGWLVRVLDNRYRCDPSTASELAALDGVEVVEGDIRYAHMVESATHGVEAVVHLAAVCMNKSIADPTESLDVNLMGTQNVLDAASRASVRRIVYASSASVYGNPTQLPMREEDKLAPITPYCVAKLAGEQMLDFYARRAQALLAGTALLQRLRPRAADRRLLHLGGRHLPEPPRSRRGARDRRARRPVDGLRARPRRRPHRRHWHWTRDATGEMLNVGTGRQTSISDLAELLVRSLGIDVQPVYRPREVLVTRREASIERIEEVLGWRPQVDLRGRDRLRARLAQAHPRGPAALTAGTPDPGRCLRTRGTRWPGSSASPWSVRARGSARSACSTDRAAWSSAADVTSQQACRSTRTPPPRGASPTAR